MRLRSFVLRERLAAREWQVQHIPGSELAADLLTKPVVLMASWEVFRRTVGLVRFVQPTESSRLCRLTEAVVALGGLMLQHGASRLVKTAGAVSLSALTAWMCCVEGLASMAKPVEEKKEPRPAQEQEKRPRENEPGPTNPTESTHDCSLTGSLTVPRLCAFRGQAMAGGPMDGPWNGAEFQGVPTGSNDRWRNLPGGWWVRVHGGLRSRLYHPVHTTTPVRCEDLEPERTTVIWHCPNGRPWTRVIHRDAWGGSLRAARISENPGGPSSSSQGSTSIPGAWTASGDPGVATPRGSVAKSWAHRPELVVHTLSAPYCAERRVEPRWKGWKKKASRKRQWNPRRRSVMAATLW